MPSLCPLGSKGALIPSGGTEMSSKEKVKLILSMVPHLKQFFFALVLRKKKPKAIFYPEHSKMHKVTAFFLYSICFSQSS